MATVLRSNTVAFPCSAQARLGGGWTRNVQRAGGGVGLHFVQFHAQIDHLRARVGVVGIERDLVRGAERVGQHAELHAALAQRADRGHLRVWQQVGVLEDDLVLGLHGHTALVVEDLDKVVELGLLLQEV